MESRPFSCHLCEYSAKLKQHLDCHVLTHSDKFACDRCYRDFRTKRNLEKHQSDHSILNFDDPRTQKIIEDEQWLRNHMRNIRYHPENDMPYECPEC